MKVKEIMCNIVYKGRETDIQVKEAYDKIVKCPNDKGFRLKVECLTDCNYCFNKEYKRR